MIPHSEWERVKKAVEADKFIETSFSVATNKWVSDSAVYTDVTETLAGLGYEEGDALFISNYEGVIDDESTDAITNYSDIAKAGIFLYEENHEQLLLCGNGSEPEHTVYFRVVIIKQ